MDGRTLKESSKVDKERRKNEGRKGKKETERNARRLKEGIQE
jgi:hypothetical protein